ncbi:MAG: hypothetical protein J7515_14195 [Caulobacter sp.]|nr:hypothetical protein [Caulobacter sp.]
MKRSDFVRTRSKFERRASGFAPIGARREKRNLCDDGLREHVMHTSHFWQSAGLIAIIFGAAVLSAMIGSRAHAHEACAPTVSSTQMH